MKKVCLVKGGNFILGIEARYILTRQNGILPHESISKEQDIFHLGSLLARKQCEQPELGSVFLLLKKGENTFFLLVDQVIDEIELPEQTTRLPPPSPELAEQLCPQVAICMNLVVLLLDPAQVIPVARELGQGTGLLGTEYFSKAKKQYLAEHSSGNVGIGEQQPMKSVATASGQLRKIKKNKKRPKSVDEETFKRVMSWTISQFKQGKIGPEHLAADQLPPGLIQQAGISDTVLQYLIDQISLRCQESITPGRSGERHGS